MLPELVASLNAVNEQQRQRAHALLHSALRVWFIGNGGSAAIASHMAVDYTKNGKQAAIACNDPVTLTCYANDFGYENVFSQQLKDHAVPSDVVVLISSSGRSPNILNAGKAARYIGNKVITFSGFDYDNPLRSMGDLNFWVDSHDYGVVEITHLAILHSMVKP